MCDQWDPQHILGSGVWGMGKLGNQADGVDVQAGLVAQKASALSSADSLGSSFKLST